MPASNDIDLYKFQPDRTMHLRGFDRRGSAGCLHGTSADGFQVTGVFRDAADFCVLMLWDADAQMWHRDARPLPHFDMSDITLSFDWASTNLQHVESNRFPTISWPRIEYVTSTGSGNFRIADYITSRTGRVDASLTLTIDASASVVFDRVTIFLNQHYWDYVVPGKRQVVFSYFAAGAGTNHTVTIDGTTYTYVELAGDSSAMVAAGVAAAAAADTKASVAAGTPAAQQVTLTSIVDDDGTIVVSASGNAPDDLWLAANPSSVVATYLRDAINATSFPSGAVVTFEASGTGADVTLDFQPGNNGSAEDANSVAVTTWQKTGTTTISPLGRTQVSGAVDSTSVSVEIPLNDALGAAVDDVLQMWITLAPKLTPDGSDYVDEEWNLQVSNWAVDDPSGNRVLKSAHPTKSTFVDSRSPWCTYAGTWVDEAGFYSRGFARGSQTPGAVATIEYACDHVHDLWLGTSLYSDRGTFLVSLDSDTPTTLDCALSVSAAVQTRRLLRSSVAAGKHVVELEHDGAGPVYVDYVHAVVEDQVVVPITPRTDRNMATDWGTDVTYKSSPQALAWAHHVSGLRGDHNHYTSVFWWNQRRRRGGTQGQLTVEFDGWDNIVSAGTASISFQFGGTYEGDPLGTTLIKNYHPGDDDETLAQHFADHVNSELVGVRAEASGAVVTITCRSFFFEFTFWAYSDSSGSHPEGDLTVDGDLARGNEGVWEIDPDATPVLNIAAQTWHEEWWQEIAARGRTGVNAFSLELANPPDDPAGGQVWAQRYKSGNPVLTSTGFGTEGDAIVDSVSGSNVTISGHGYSEGALVTFYVGGPSGASRSSWKTTVVDDDTIQLVELVSVNVGGSIAAGDGCRQNFQTTHCAFSTVVQDYYKQAFLEMAELMHAAGLEPWLQFGEILHWFFSEKFSRPITATTNASPIVLTCQGHGLATGQEALVTGVRGNVAANGSWTIMVLDADTLSLDGSVGNGTSVAYQPVGQGSPIHGLLTGGSMAIHDDDQEAAALVALGRPLATFWHQDSDPDVSSGADRDFLRDRLRDYVDGIVSHVLATRANAKFELLWPEDVNHETAYWNRHYPYPQGGRFNAAVNLPTEWYAKAGSNIDRFKSEALSWGSGYRNLELAKSAAFFPRIEIGWAAADHRHLVPWFNGGCPWQNEHVDVDGVTNVSFWAYDHFVYLGWPAKLPRPRRSARVA